MLACIRPVSRARPHTRIYVSWLVVLAPQFLYLLCVYRGFPHVPPCQSPGIIAFNGMLIFKCPPGTTSTTQHLIWNVKATLPLSSKLLVVGLPLHEAHVVHAGLAPRRSLSPRLSPRHLRPCTCHTTCTGTHTVVCIPAHVVCVTVFFRSCVW
jgi:hypothetical protein